MSDQSQSFPVLETERLLLRQLSAQDSQELVNLYADEVVTRFIDIEAMKNVDQANGLVVAMNNLYSEGTGLRWGAFEKEDSLLIGTVGFHDWDHKRSRAEISYDLNKRHWGQGYMREALTAILGYGFSTLKLNRVEALVDPADNRSKNLLYSLGFKLEGVLREHDYIKGQYLDDMVFALLRVEWFSGS